MIILNKTNLNTGSRGFRHPVSLKELTPRVSKYFRFNDDNFRNLGIDEIHIADSYETLFSSDTAHSPTPKSGATLVPADQVLHRAVALAERVAAQAPLAVQATLESARLALEDGPGAAVARLYEQLHRLMATQDAQEGVASFLERRTARFTGK